MVGCLAGVGRNGKTDKDNSIVERVAGQMCKAKRDNPLQKKLNKDVVFIRTKDRTLNTPQLSNIITSPALAVQRWLEQLILSPPSCKEDSALSMRDVEFAMLYGLLAPPAEDRLVT